jgi:hypothetical protein
VKLFTIGDRVSQPSYGTGTITLVNEYHTVVDFDEHGPRTFSTSLVQLEKSNTLAPVRPVKRGRRKAAPSVART